MEKVLEGDNIYKRKTGALDKSLSNEEMDDIYHFVQSNVFERLFKSDGLFNIISSQFQDISNEIDNLKKKYGDETETFKPTFEPILVNKENGFYATVDYNNLSDNKNIKLEEKPSTTFRDIQKVEKGHGYNNISEIIIQFTKEGAKKFQQLTKENIGKPIAIVLQNALFRCRPSTLK